MNPFIFLVQFWKEINIKFRGTASDQISEEYGANIVGCFTDCKGKVSSFMTDPKDSDYVYYYLEGLVACKGNLIIMNFTILICIFLFFIFFI